MRWIILFSYLSLMGCMGTAISGANAVYKHKTMQDGLCDYYITIKSWNTLKNEFSFENLKYVHLNSFHRIVLLTGQVTNQNMREHVEQSLKCIPKIARIYNAITIEPGADTQRQLADTWITTKVKSKMIASNELYADKIKVITEKKIVYLVGIVTKEEAEIAIELAKQTEGVNQVVTIFYYMTMPTIQ